MQFDCSFVGGAIVAAAGNASGFRAVEKFRCGLAPFDSCATDEQVAILVLLGGRWRTRHPPLRENAFEPRERWDVPTIPFALGHGQILDRRRARRRHLFRRVVVRQGFQASQNHVAFKSVIRVGIAAGRRYPSR
jgi:hypothetical protein